MLGDTSTAPLEGIITKTHGSSTPAISRGRSAHPLRPAAVVQSARSGVVSMMRVLLTEDDQRLSDSIRRGLRNVGIEAVVADTAAAARERIVFATHDVIVLDVTLPDGNGFELCAFARARGDMATTSRRRTSACTARKRSSWPRASLAS
jgi:PleD family two-component response regulator